MLAEDRFHAWSGQHYLIMLVTAVGAVGVAWWGRRHRDTTVEVVVRRGFAAVSLLVVVALQIYWVTPGQMNVRSSWPLQLSDLADYSAIFALWTRGPRSTAFTYYVGLTLTLMAILTPALTEPFPHPQWFGFWFRHMSVVWAAVYLVWGLGLHPTWRLYRRTVAAVLVWAAVAYTFDVVVGANYGYLVDKPATASALDLLGPWPWYVLAAMGILLAIWAVVFTLPWERRRARAAR
ncbi:TIGR02206 family membrane protein [Nocardioides sp. AN3]